MPPTSFPAPPRTLPDLVRRAAAHFPARGIALFDSRGRAAARRTYPEFLAAAELAARRLRARGVGPGDRVLVCLPSGWSWFEAWFGALLLGAWPVAVAPGAALGSSEAQIDRVERLIERFGARLLICGEVFSKDAHQVGAPRIAEVGITPPDLERGAAAASLPALDSDPDAVAFLQLTSGSTGFPRGVMVPHRAAIHNSWASDEGIGGLRGPCHEWADAMVSWLPLYHDLGLVGCVLLSLYCGFDLWLLQPRAFLARPALWLQQLGRRGKTIGPAPNFGYQLCLERARDEDLAGLDLSGWTSAMTGAEMIRPETVSAFCERFGSLGFAPESFRPCYGLAEATLAVTFDQRGEGVRTRPAPAAIDAGQALSEVVCIGAPIRDTELRIAAPDGAALPAGQVGEVWVKGPGVFLGYYEDPEATAEGLTEGWLRTGDLGFLDRGELYLTGRTKDLLILHGHNVMPHELEWIADSVAAGGGALRSGAFSIARGAQGEEAVLVVETETEEPGLLGALEHEVRTRIGRALSLPLADVVFVSRGRIPKTTSGKVQRRELRRAYLDGELVRIHPTSA